MAAQVPGASVAPPNFVWAAKLLGVHSDPLPRPLLQGLNSCGAAVVTDLQLDVVPLITTLLKKLRC